MTTAIGSINFASGVLTATFTFSSSVTLSLATLEFVGGTADTSILGIYFTIAGTRS